MEEFTDNEVENFFAGVGWAVGAVALMASLGLAIAYFLAR